MGRFGLKDAFSVRVGVGEGHFMRLHLDVGSVPRGNADIAARVLNLNGAVGSDLGVENLLVVVLLGAAK